MAIYLHFRNEPDVGLPRFARSDDEVLAMESAVIARNEVTKQSMPYVLKTGSPRCTRDDGRGAFGAP